MLLKNFLLLFALFSTSALSSQNSQSSQDSLTLKSDSASALVQISPPESDAKLDAASFCREMEIHESLLIKPNSACPHTLKVYEHFSVTHPKALRFCWQGLDWIRKYEGKNSTCELENPLSMEEYSKLKHKIRRASRYMQKLLAPESLEKEITGMESESCKSQANSLLQYRKRALTSLQNNIRNIDSIVDCVIDASQLDSDSQVSYESIEPVSYQEELMELTTPKMSKSSNP